MSRPIRSARRRVLASEFGYASGRAPRLRSFSGALEEDLDRMRAFLGAERINVLAANR